MDNLNKMGVTELNNNQTKKINGGFWGKVGWLVLGAAIQGVYEGIKNDWKEVKEAYRAGYEVGKS